MKYLKMIFESSDVTSFTDSKLIAEISVTHIDFLKINNLIEIWRLNVACEKLIFSQQVSASL